MANRIPGWDGGVNSPGTTAAPSTTTSKNTTTTATRRPGASTSGYTPPKSTYTAPAPSYSAPSYSAPSYSAPSYSAPSYSAPSYSAPATTQSVASAPVYSAPSEPVAQPYVPPAPTTETITIPDAKADSTYQQQVSYLAKMMSDYQANQHLASQQYGQGYDRNLKNLGYDQAGNQWDQQGQGAYGQSFGANEGDFAGRGAYFSGQYGKSVGDLTGAFNQQKVGMDQAKDQYGATQARGLEQYQNQNGMDKQAALTDAAGRIAAQYGLDLNQVPKGTGPKQLTRPIGG